MLIYFSGFIAFIIILLALDLGVFHRRDLELSTKSALLWTAFWIVLALLFNVLVYVFYEHHWLGIGTGAEYAPLLTGSEAAVAFFTAYIIEKSLSIDNIFVIAMIFNYFHIPPKYQHRVLFWGILGALFMRGIMIFCGIAAIERWSFVTYILGGLLLITAVRMLVVQQDKLRPEKNMAIKLVGKCFSLTKKYFGHSFFVKLNGKWTATPLFLALILIESTDLLFAIDSIPAVLAITLDPFIVFTSNVFAILGMRSLYFALASLLGRFRYLKQSLIFILGFVGIKLLLAHHLTIDPLISLWIILGILATGMVASL